MKSSGIPFRQSAFTLVEVLVACAAASILMASLSAGILTLQRSLTVNLGIADSESDMLRLGDYLSMDLRRAETVSTGSDADGNSVLTLTVPDCYESDEPSNDAYNQLRDVRIVDENVVYGSGASAMVEYKLAGGHIRRFQSGFPTSVVSDADSFKLAIVDDRLNSQVAFTASFTSQYHPIYEAKLRTVEGVVRTRNPRKD